MPVHPSYPRGHGWFLRAYRGGDLAVVVTDASPSPVCIRGSDMLALGITEPRGKSSAPGMAASRSRVHQARNVPRPLLEPERGHPCLRDSQVSPPASPPCAFVLAIMWGV
jgi:hypothetical protein